MLMLLLTACAVTCFDRLTSTRARPQAERRRSRATRFSRGDTQPIHRNTNSDFSMFSSSRQTDFRTAESTLSARRRDHERQIWRCISSFAPIWILLLFIFKWIGAVVVEIASHLIGHRPRTMLPGCDRSSDWTDELDPGIGGSHIHRAAWLGPIRRVTAPIASSVSGYSRRTLIVAGTSLLEASHRTPSENLASAISPISSLAHSAATVSRAPARAVRSITRTLTPAGPPSSPSKRVRRGGTGRKRPERISAPLTVTSGVSLPQLQATSQRRGRAFLGGSNAFGSTDPTKLIHFVVDSGATWHVHHDAQDLLNVRPCADIIEGIDRTDHRCTAIGDLPMICTDHRGKAFRLTIHNVRVVPSLNISLLSVGQLWKDDRIDARFADSNEAIVLQQYDPSQSPEVRFKFAQDNGLFRWKVLGVARGLSARQQKAQALSAVESSGKDDAIRSSVSKSFLDKLPVQHAAEIMNRRLHLGRDRLRALVDLTADAPKRLGSAGSPLREHWTEANAPHLAHPGEGYTPSHAGRLVHGDIVGPFRTSHHGQYKWALILVDDHTRFKMAYAMRAKSDAPMYVRRFLAAFKAFGSIGKTQAMSVVGALHTDNAGEFLSREFSELMDDELIHHTTCPPHVHQLNGVAERAIRSIMEVLRADLVASNSPTSFWPYALQHAVNILNRTTGPPLGDSLASSFELLTGSKPKVLSIMPFGCRTFAVKPRSFYSKTEIDARAWTGINLGANPSSPGAYNIWLPVEGKIF